MAEMHVQEDMYWTPFLIDRTVIFSWCLQKQSHKVQFILLLSAQIYLIC